MRGGQIYNLSGGVVGFQSDSDVGNYSVGTEVLSNQGTILKSGGTGMSTIDVPVPNRGVIDVQMGTVSLEFTHDLTGGRLNCGINGLGNNGQVRLAGSASLTGSFSANLNNGYRPNPGDAFNGVTYDPRLGTFSVLVRPPVFTWRTDYGSTTVTLQVLGTLIESGTRVSPRLRRATHRRPAPLPGTIACNRCPKRPGSKVGETTNA